MKNKNEANRKMLLNPQSPIPLYRQLADQLRDKIHEGTFVPGNRIPSEHQLSAEHGIGRPTVRQAIEVLVQKGLLTRRRGAGTFVCERQQEVDLFSLDGTSASFIKKGVAIETRIIEPMHLRDVSDKSNPFNGGQAFFMSRLTLTDNMPVLIEDLYLQPDLFPGIDGMNLRNRSLSTVVEETYYLRPTGGKQSFGIGYLKGNAGGHLQVDARTPVLEVKRHLHFPRTANGVFAHLWCRTDHFVFTQNIGGADHA